MTTTKKNPQLEALETALEQVRAGDFDAAQRTLEELLAAIEASTEDTATTEAARSLAQRSTVTAPRRPALSVRERRRKAAR